MHTNWTDGNSSLEQMVERAYNNGLSEIAITDHIRKQSDYYKDYVEAIEKIRTQYPIKVYCGFETKILDYEGNVDIPQEAMDLADIVIASVHRIPWGSKYRLPKEIEQGELADIEKNLVISTIRNHDDINVIGHCGGMSIAAYGSFPEEYFKEVIRECAEHGIAFEYNFKYHCMYEELLKELLKKYNPFVSIGSDAHEAGIILDGSFIS